VSVETRGAVRADDAEILEPVVVTDAVDVVEDHGDSCPAPNLAMAAQFANRLPEPILIEAPLQVLA